MSVLVDRTRVAEGEVAIRNRADNNERGLDEDDETEDSGTNDVSAQGDNAALESKIDSSHAADVSAAIEEVEPSSPEESIAALAAAFLDNRDLWSVGDSSQLFSPCRSPLGTGSIHMQLPLRCLPPSLHSIVHQYIPDDMLRFGIVSLHLRPLGTDQARLHMAIQLKKAVQRVEDDMFGGALGEYLVPRVIATLEAQPDGIHPDLKNWLQALRVTGLWEKFKGGYSPHRHFGWTIHAPFGRARIAFDGIYGERPGKHCVAEAGLYNGTWIIDLYQFLPGTTRDWHRGTLPIYKARPNWRLGFTQIAAPRLQLVWDAVHNAMYPKEPMDEKTAQKAAYFVKRAGEVTRVFKLRNVPGIQLVYAMHCLFMVEHWFQCPIKPFLSARADARIMSQREPLL